MAVPTTRAEFKAACLRRLGAPVIKVNVSDEQVDDRLDYALAKFRDYHFDGSQLTYVPHQVTPTDQANRYLTVPANVVDVVDLYPLSSTIMGAGAWNVQYQFLLTSMEVFRSMDMSNWVITMQNLQMIQEILVGQQAIRFNRYDDKLYIDTDWSVLAAGDFVVYSAYVAVDPDVMTKMWSDPWLLRYTCAQIKQQWGQHVSKYNGVEILGGVTFNGQQMVDAADKEIEDLETALIRDFSIPVSNFIGGIAILINSGIIGGLTWAALSTSGLIENISVFT